MMVLLTGEITGAGTMAVPIGMRGGTIGIEMTGLLLGEDAVLIDSVIAIVMTGGAVLTDLHVTIDIHPPGEIPDRLLIVMPTIAGGTLVGVDPEAPLTLEGEVVSSAHHLQGVEIEILIGVATVGMIEMTGGMEIEMIGGSEMLDLGRMIVVMVAGIIITIYEDLQHTHHWGMGTTNAWIFKSFLLLKLLFCLQHLSLFNRACQDLLIAILIAFQFTLKPN